MVEFTYVSFSEDDLIEIVLHKMDEKYRNKHIAARTILHTDEEGTQDLCVEYVLSDCKEELDRHVKKRKSEYAECFRNDCPRKRKEVRN